MKSLLIIGSLLFSALLLQDHGKAASDLDLFLAKCGSCHKSGGQAAPVNPADKGGLVWKKYFERNRHPVDISKSMTEEETSEILNFLQHHAADGNHPIAAIIPK